MSASSEPRMAADAIFMVLPARRLVHVCAVVFFPVVASSYSVFGIFATIESARLPDRELQAAAFLLATLLWSCVVCRMGLASYRLIELCYRRIGVADFGITSLRPGRPPLTLRWDEVVQIREQPLMQRLTLRCSDRNRSMTVAVGLLERPEELLDLVYGHWYVRRRQARDGLALPRTFHRRVVFGRFALVPLAVAPAVVGAMAGLDHGVIHGLAGVAVSLVVCALFVTSVGAKFGHLTVTDEGIVRHDPGTLSRAYSFGQIGGAALTARGIIVKLGAAKRVVLGHFREGTFEAYDALVAAWRGWKGREGDHSSRPDLARIAGPQVASLTKGAP